jgi:hypothetical protein
LERSGIASDLSGVTPDLSGTPSEASGVLLEARHVRLEMKMYSFPLSTARPARERGLTGSILGRDLSIPRTLRFPLPIVLR